MIYIDDYWDIEFKLLVKSKHKRRKEQKTYIISGAGMMEDGFTNRKYCSVKSLIRACKLKYQFT